MNYYNEINPDAAAWLRELIRAGHIAPGIVDERSITEIDPEEIQNYCQRHFFAGIGGWSYALRLAGWPDDEPVDTGSCPCQPLSCAGLGKGHADKRHLWPAFHAHIAQRKTAIVFGEQVASALGREWLAGIRADLEDLGYAVGGADLCAAGVSAPMVSQRLHWVAAAVGSERWPPTERRIDVSHGKNSGREETASGCGIRGEDAVGLAAANSYHEHWWSGPLQVGWNCIEGEVDRGGRKFRAQWRVKPGLSLLADGIPGRVAQLCGFGNAIVPQLAAQFIQAAVETLSSL